MGETDSHNAARTLALQTLGRIDAWQAKDNRPHAEQQLRTYEKFALFFALRFALLFALFFALLFALLFALFFALLFALLWFTSCKGGEAGCAALPDGAAG